MSGSNEVHDFDPPGKIGIDGPAVVAGAFKCPQVLGREDVLIKRLRQAVGYGLVFIRHQNGNRSVELFQVARVVIAVPDKPESREEPVMGLKRI